ncbi:MAG TPA: VanZ family protein [Woeseiaceae bacterium]|nr:VanZ family protein [Woeseiaceae bacterium]
MLELRYARAWGWLSIVCLVLVLAATVLPADWLWPDDPSLRFDLDDKWLHGLTFFGLALWFCGQFRPSSYWRIAVGLLAFGVLIEIVQRAVSYRSAELLDLAADMAGIVAGVLIAVAGAGGWAPRFEDWLQSKLG